MPVTVRELVERAGLGLRLHPAVSGAVVRESTAAVAPLDAEITWVHSSDLLDPTPWLEAGQLLLTDGSHLDADFDRTAADRYAARLTRTGIVALGFAVGVVHDRVPAPLVEACRDAGLPLLLVPEAMPFLRIVRHVADVAAADRSERLTWSIAAQRAIARATLQPDGLGATLRELEVRLGCWVALYDRLGRRIPVRTREQPPAELLPAIGTAVRAQLERGRRAASHLAGGGHDITLQTIGQGERLRGVLAVGTSVPLDPAGSDLLASVIGIASVAIEQGRALDHARSALRRGVLELLLAGAAEAAARALRELGTWVPGGSVRVAVAADVTAWDAVLDELELLAAGEPFTFARLDDELVLLWDAGGVRTGASALRRPQAVSKSRRVRSRRTRSRSCSGGDCASACPSPCRRKRSAPASTRRAAHPAAPSPASSSSSRSCGPAALSPGSSRPAPRSPRAACSPRCASAPTPSRSSRARGCGSRTTARGIPPPASSASTATRCAHASTRSAPRSTSISAASAPAPSSGRRCASSPTTETGPAHCPR